jgi:hypothetical protein
MAAIPPEKMGKSYCPLQPIKNLDRQEGGVPDLKSLTLKVDAANAIVNVVFYESYNTHWGDIYIYMYGEGKCRYNLILKSPTKYLLLKNKDADEQFETEVTSGSVAAGDNNRSFTMRLPLNLFHPCKVKRMWAYCMTSKDRLPDTGSLVIDIEGYSNLDPKEGSTRDLKNLFLESVKQNTRFDFSFNKSHDFLCREPYSYMYGVVTNNLHVKGKIKVGENSLYISEILSPLPPLDPFDLIQSTNGRLLFLNTNYGSLNTLDDMSLGIGGYTHHKLSLNNFDDTEVYQGFTNLATGVQTPDDGFILGIDKDGYARLNQQEDLPMIFSTNDRENMRIINKDVNLPGGNAPRTRVTINKKPGFPIPTAHSLLHLGDGQTGGHRNWMDVGTFMSDETDNMYVGLRKFSYDNHDAVINWGDNYLDDNIGPNSLRFIFTSPLSTSPGFTFPSFTNDGKEISRMTYKYSIARMGIDEPNPRAKVHITANPPEILYQSPSPAGDPYLHLRLTRNVNQFNTDLANSDFKTTTGGNLMINTYIKNLLSNIVALKNVGIGPFDINSQPKRRLDIMDEENQQLRLSYSIGQTYTDFHTTDAGNLLIQPSGEKVGINLTGTPTHTLDVNGQARIRGLVPGPNLGLLCYDNDGVVRPLLFPQNDDLVLLGDGSWGTTSGYDHDWYKAGTTDVPNDISDKIYTYNNVGIGTNTPDSAMLELFNNSMKVGIDAKTIMPSTAAGSYFGVKGTVSDSPFFYNVPIAGVKGMAQGNHNFYNIGVWGHAINGAEYNIGIFGNATNGAYNIGVLGRATNGVNNIGVYGFVDNNNDRAGLFHGNVDIIGGLTVGGIYYPSDQVLKENVQNINNSMDIISQLNPKSFTFKTKDYPQLNLTDGLNFGLIAQELETVLPDLVTTAKNPAVYDENGKLIYKGLEFKCLNYTALIAILIQGIKDQQAMLKQYEKRLKDVEGMLAQCCNDVKKAVVVNNDVTADAVVNNIPDEMLNADEEVLFHNYPNPFKNNKTFAYKLAKGGDVQLTVNSFIGQHIATIVSQSQEAGSYSVYWDTSDISPGVYFYSLKVDGLEWVRKAVKIK